MQLRLSSRDALILAIVAIIAAAGLFVAFVIVPRFTEIRRLDAEMAQVDQQIAEARAVLARRQDAKAASAKTQAELLALANRMPDAPEMPSLIIELQDAANEAGVEFTMLKPGEPSPDSGFTSIPMGMKLEGQWSDLIEYFRRLARLERQVRVVEIKVKPKSDDGATTELEAEVQLEAYTLASPGSGAAAAPPPTTTPAQ